MLILQILSAETFATVHFVHFAEGGFHAVDGGKDVEGVAGF